MATVFIDESKRGRYTMVAVTVAQAELAWVRKDLRGLIPAGQRRIHFKSDSPETRRRALALIAGMPLDVFIVEAPKGIHESLARRRCLEEIAGWVPTGSRLVLEIDAGIVDADRAILEPLHHARSFDYGHMTPHSDPGLWLPDAVAWSWTRGGEWREALRGVVRSATTLE